MNVINEVAEAFRLANKCLLKNDFYEASKYLSTVGHILEQENLPLSQEKLEWAKSELARNWVAYGMRLFKVSKRWQTSDIFYSGEDAETSEDPEIMMDWRRLQCEQILVGGQKKSGSLQPKDQQIDHNTSDSFNLESTNSSAQFDMKFDDDRPYHFRECNDEPVSVNILKTRQEARALHNFTHTWLKRIPKQHMADYIRDVLKLCELYDYLSWYENDLSIKLEILKRRLHMLSTLRIVLRRVLPTSALFSKVELLHSATKAQVEMLTDIPQDNDLERPYLSFRRMEILGDIQNKVDTFSNELFQKLVDEDEDKSSTKLLAVENS